MQLLYIYSPQIMKLVVNDKEKLELKKGLDFIYQFYLDNIIKPLDDNKTERVLTKDEILFAIFPIKILMVIILNEQLVSTSIISEYDNTKTRQLDQMETLTLMYKYYIQNIRKDLYMLEETQKHLLRYIGNVFRTGKTEVYELERIDLLVEISRILVALYKDRPIIIKETNINTLYLHYDNQLEDVLSNKFSYKSIQKFIKFIETNPLHNEPVTPYMDTMIVKNFKEVGTYKFTKDMRLKIHEIFVQGIPIFLGIKFNKEYIYLDKIKYNDFKHISFNTNITLGYYLQKLLKVIDKAILNKRLESTFSKSYNRVSTFFKLIDRSISFDDDDDFSRTISPLKFIRKPTAQDSFDEINILKVFMYLVEEELAIIKNDIRKSKNDEEKDDINLKQLLEEEDYDTITQFLSRYDNNSKHIKNKIPDLKYSKKLQVIKHTSKHKDIHSKTYNLLSNSTLNNNAREYDIIQTLAAILQELLGDEKVLYPTVLVSNSIQFYDCIRTIFPDIKEITQAIILRTKKILILYYFILNQGLVRIRNVQDLIYLKHPIKEKLDDDITPNHKSLYMRICYNREKQIKCTSQMNIYEPIIRIIHKNNERCDETPLNIMKIRLLSPLQNRLKYLREVNDKDYLKPYGSIKDSIKTIKNLSPACCEMARVGKLVEMINDLAYQIFKKDPQEFKELFPDYNKHQITIFKVRLNDIIDRKGRLKDTILTLANLIFNQLDKYKLNELPMVIALILDPITSALIGDIIGTQYAIGYDDHQCYIKLMKKLRNNQLNEYEKNDLKEIQSKIRHYKAFHLALAYNGTKYITADLRYTFPLFKEFLPTEQTFQFLPDFLNEAITNRVSEQFRLRLCKQRGTELKYNAKGCRTVDLYVDIKTKVINYHSVKTYFSLYNTLNDHLGYIVINRKPILPKNNTNYEFMELDDDDTNNKFMDEEDNNDKDSDDDMQ